MTDLNLDRLARLEANATPGRWTWYSQQTVDGDTWAVFDSKDHALAENRDGWSPDAEFIAEMRNATPALLARVLELEVTVEKVREAVSGHPKCDIYDDDDPITCWWKSAYRSVVKALGDD